MLWEQSSRKFPLLNQIFEICAGIPSTQCPCERDFSCLKLLVSEKRTSLSSKLIDDILLIKLNK